MFLIIGYCKRNDAAVVALEQAIALKLGIKQADVLVHTTCCKATACKRYTGGNPVFVLVDDCIFYGNKAVGRRAGVALPDTRGGVHGAGHDEIVGKGRDTSHLEKING